jgi:hypothetical protein
MLNAIWNRAKCATLGHDFEPWEYVAAADCIQARYCKRSRDHLEKRTEHVWGAWTFLDREPKNCEQVRTCARDHATESRTVHTWGEWVFLAEDSCKQERKCSRCMALESRERHENVGPAQYKTPGLCNVIAQCTRCKLWVPQKTQHERYEWVYDNPQLCLGKERCVRCGHTQNPGFKHRPYIWKRLRANTCEMNQICPHCGMENPNAMYFIFRQMEHEVLPDGVCRRCRKKIR